MHESRLPKALAKTVSAVAVAWMAMVVFAAPAAAHPVLLFTDPALDGAVADAPNSVTLVFNEAVTVSSAGITVLDSRDREVPVGASRTAKDDTVVRASLPERLPPGVYRVVWSATGLDGHGIDGEFRFAVGAVVTDLAASDGGPPTDWSSAALRWLLLGGFAFAFGGLVGERFTSTAGRENPDLPPLPAWSQYAAVGGLVATLLSGAVLLSEIGQVSAFWQSRPGIVILADAAGFLLALAVMATRQRSWALVPLALVAVAEGSSSHSNVELPIIGALLTAVHLVAVALWTGTVLHVARAAWRWRSWSSAARWVLLCYARLAVWVFVSVVATGIVMVLLLVPVDAVLSTAYGVTLLIKLGLVLAATGLAIAGRWALRRRERLGLVKHTVRVESAILVLVLAASAVLISTPTPDAAGNAPPPPPPRGPAVPAGGLAGQIGVNMVASQGQVIVRLSTPRPGNVYRGRAEVEYELTGRRVPEGGQAVALDFRSCGGGCFVAPATWSRGDNVVSLRVGASGWRGGRFAARIPWPVTPAPELVRRTVRVMRGLDEFTIYESGTSDTGAGLPEPQRLTVDGQTLLSNEPYNSGVAPIAVQANQGSEQLHLLMGFPAAGVHVDITLDARGRIVTETLTGPKHVFHRRFRYPDEH